MYKRWTLVIKNNEKTYLSSEGKKKTESESRSVVSDSATPWSM